MQPGAKLRAATLLKLSLLMQHRRFAPPRSSLLPTPPVFLTPYNTPPFVSSLRSSVRRDQLMLTLKKGREELKTALQHVEVKRYDENERMDDAVAKLLANRAAIAGESDSDSDSDSDLDFDSDDDYP